LLLVIVVFGARAEFFWYRRLTRSTIAMLRLASDIDSAVDAVITAYFLTAVLSGGWLGG